MDNLTLKELLKDLDGQTQDMLKSIITTLVDDNLLEGQSIQWRHGNDHYGFQCSLEKFKSTSNISSLQGTPL